MSSASVKVRRTQLRLQKKALQIQSAAQQGELLKTALQSPVLAGTMAFLGVHFLETVVLAAASKPKQAVGNTADQKAASLGSKSTFNFLGVLINPQTVLGQLEAAIQGGTGSLAQGGSAGGVDLASIFTRLDFEALKLVILIYIASGGNLAGLLQSASGQAAIGGFLSKVGATTAISVIP